VQKEDKEKIVTELTEKLRSSETMIVADYRGLTMTQIDALRTRLIENGARFTVVKNTLTRRAAEAAGADALLALLEGPSAIAFVEADGDAVAVAKALADSVRDTKVLEIKGGVMQGRVITGAEVDALAKLPPFDVLRSQVIGAVIAPLNAIAGLINAPLQNLYGLLEARIDQLGDASPPAADSLAQEPDEPQLAGQPEADSPQEEEADGGS
jgi:large subunit ribosomal protein L10